MKRLLLGWILVSAGASAACASEAPAPVNNTTGGTGGTGQGGTTAANGGSGMVGGSGATTTTGGSGGTGNTGTGGSGGTGNTGTGGTSGMPAMGGTAGSTSGSAGMSPGGNGGTSGAGMMMMGGTAGMGGSAGTPAGGMSGDAGAPAGGMSGTAGAPTAGMSGGGSGGMEEDLMAVAAPLDGQTILMPCDHDTEVRVCIPRAAASKPCTGTGPSYAGTHSHNQQVTLGGEAGVRYLVTLHIRGMTEAKTYTGGMDRSNSGTQVPADGLYIGGQADNSGNGYNIYFIRTDSPPQYYYLNSIGAGNDTRIRHSVFESDFDVDIPVDGGSKVCLVSADPNTSAIKNCQDPEGNLTTCNPMTLPNLDAPTTSAIKSQPYNGQFVGISVKGVKRM